MSELTINYLKSAACRLSNTRLQLTIAHTSEDGFIVTTDSVFEEDEDIAVANVSSGHDFDAVVAEFHRKLMAQTLPRPTTRKARSAHGSASFVTFNINDYVQVRLTDRGRACLRENYDKLNAAYGGKLTFKHTPPKEDKDGWSRWQAWSLMQNFGPHISMGMDPPFETTIRVEVRG